jgi:hypothetical protein
MAVKFPISITSLTCLITGATEMIFLVAIFFACHRFMSLLEFSMVSKRFAFIGLFCLLLSGCFDNGDTRPMAAVSVTVTYKGKPVDGATITFVSSVNPEPTNGLTNAEGICSMRAIVGRNVITISKNEIDKNNIKPLKPEDQDLIGVSPIPTLKKLLPAKYAEPGTSGLEETVNKGANSFKYELKD